MMGHPVRFHSTFILAELINNIVLLQYLQKLPSFTFVHVGDHNCIKENITNCT